jgi:hypothetical protein
LDRKFVYPAQLPLSDDFLKVQRNTMIALAYDVQAWGGTGAIADGLTCIPSVPASLAVQVTPGSLCQLASVDQSSFGSQLIDVTHQIMQQGILLDSTSVTLTPPTTAGQAINYLIQVQFQQNDTDAAVLAYFNASAPTVPFMGPANSGTAQPTSRKGIVLVQAKAGVAATAGTQVTPSADAGFVGLYSVTVANGATALTSAQIAMVSTAPFISVKLPQVPTYVQNGGYAYGIDTGTANAMAVTLNPVPGAYPYSIFVKKMGSANTGAMTVTVAPLGTVAVVNADGTAITTGQMAAGFMAHLVFDGTSYRFMNGVAATGVGSITGTSGEGITVGGTTPFPVSMNVPGLTTNNAPGNTDIFPYFNQTDAHHRVITWVQLIAALVAGSPGSLLRMVSFAASGTWTKGANTRKIIAFGLGAGGAGASNQGSKTVTITTSSANYVSGHDGQVVNSIPLTQASVAMASGGGGAGGGFLIMQDVTAISSLAVVIGTGGAAVSNSPGAAGGDTSLGALATAHGGLGGFLNALSSGNVTGGGGGPGGTASLAGGVIGISWSGDAGTAASPFDGGKGGSTLYGGGGQGGDDVNGITGASGQPGSYGGGGGGADRKGVGGAGGGGLVIILEFA